LNSEFLKAVWESIQQIDEDEDRRERILQVYKKGADDSTSGFQKGHEIWEEDFLSKLYPLHPEEREPVSPIRDRGKERNWSGDISESNETLHQRIFSSP
jgi:hypothetical protein